MKHQSNKRLLRKGPFIVLALFVLLIFIGGQVLLFLPITEYQTTTLLKSKIENHIQPLSFIGFLPAKTLLSLPLKEIIGESYQFKKIERLGLFRWKIQITEPTSVFFVSINNYLYPCDRNGTILTIPNVTGSLAQGNEDILYSITIARPQIKEFDESNPAVSSFDFTDIYNIEVQPFIEYIVQSSSHLGPQISDIVYTVETGIEFTKSSTAGHSIQCIFGKEKSYSNLEKKLSTTEKYLKKQNTYKEFNCIDLRFRRQAVCSNTEKPPSEEQEKLSSKDVTKEKEATDTQED
jgi:hypothetical protein